ncbi:MAG: SDR family NAD(P)-dependent oxidoreductase [Clostridiales bacterium]|nr:SDR family NAD(P)-dependent oxidoreductase [Clostridiales bacterium]MBS5877390.1 SDR family NAD(P)-dependent oxidoreductase [Clostridiales bacterium]MDU0939231.1 SDR family NAD(P)-dependent oxidoreductase [Clostridiales bacterium]MDU1042124.1 SDR family NAD(P)-dependent oxidoreductase [Clostridiales bacterium]MDU3490295.1 SDR family NAD(P)-dependent oxidoreductase [Clostridiales bacterium]
MNINNIDNDNSNDNKYSCLSGKTLVITGASRGIGRALALKSAQSGLNLAVSCYKNEEKLDSLVKEVRSMGADCLKYVGDMGDSKNVRSFFSLIREKYGHADFLVNNAGISHIGLLQDMTDSEWRRLFQTNVDSFFYTSREFIKDSIPRKKGSIINISSVWGEAGASMETAYSASKGAVNSFTKALAKELAPSGINVNAISCGIIDTDMNACFSEDDLNDILNEIPAGRMGLPEEVALTALNLLTGPSYLTGQIIRLDGGWI